MFAGGGSLGSLVGMLLVATLSDDSQRVAFAVTDAKLFGKLFGSVADRAARVASAVGLPSRLLRRHGLAPLLQGRESGQKGRSDSGLK